MSLRSLSVGILITATLALVAACGKDSATGPSTVTLKNLPLQLDLPAGWKVTTDEDSKYVGRHATISHKGNRQIEVREDEIVYDLVEAFEKAWLEQEKKSGKDIVIVERDVFDYGFGFTYELKGKKLLHYHVKVGDKTYELETNEMYSDPDALEASLAVIRSARAPGSSAGKPQ